MSTNDRGTGGTEVAAWNLTSNDNPLAEEFYRSAISDWYGVSHIDPDRTFFTHNRIYRFGNYVIARGKSVGQMLVRGPEEIRCSGLDSVAVLLDLAGMKGNAAGRDINSPPGSFHLRDFARPSAFKVEAVDAIVLAMPRDQAPAWLADGNIHGRYIDGTSQLSRLLTGQLMAILRAAPGLSMEEGVASIEAALVIVERAFKGTGMLNATQTEALYRQLRASAVVLIDQRLQEPDLKIDQLVHALGTSRATLFRAFASSGGINLYIRHRRLDRAREVLLARRGRRPSVAEIGRAHGFASESHFSRSFQDQFGHRPGAHPVAACSLPPSDSGEMRYDLFLHWIGSRE